MAIGIKSIQWQPVAFDGNRRQPMAVDGMHGNRWHSKAYEVTCSSKERERRLYGRRSSSRSSALSTGRRGSNDEVAIARRMGGDWKAFGRRLQSSGKATGGDSEATWEAIGEAICKARLT